ncbi:hypothetical protein A6X21_21075 [Planctopirus hydrillae]|uniref:Uncharacterized protein n=1 Tax=Planctopirus hydrillae TaxID=1841610 RepID=A0A1C3EHW2_9PLAN|nr:hypothetical protein A6X21_21075 [Planctopirus hydrillae]
MRTLWGTVFETQVTVSGDQPPLIEKNTLWQFLEALLPVILMSTGKSWLRSDLRREQPAEEMDHFGN